MHFFYHLWLLEHSEKHIKRHKKSCCYIIYARTIKEKLKEMCKHSVKKYSFARTWLILRWWWVYKSWLTIEFKYVANIPLYNIVHLTLWEASYVLFIIHYTWYSVDIVISTRYTQNSEISVKEKIFNIVMVMLGILKALFTMATS